MTGQEFRETGLHKLNDEELAALNAWIRERSLTLEEIGAQGRGPSQDPQPATSAEPAEAAGDPRGLGNSSNRTPINSRIVGSFTGWRGNTEFELENGMVWRQTENDTFVIREIENPEVRIRPGSFGSWRLSVEGYNSSVSVERVR